MTRTDRLAKFYYRGDTSPAQAPASSVYPDQDYPGDWLAFYNDPVARAAMGSGFRLTMLHGNDVRNLYDAMSFLTWHTGLFFNASVTLNASALGFSNHKEFVALLPHWHKEMNRYLFDASTQTVRPRSRAPTKRSIGQPKYERVRHPHYWIQVVEYARDKGLHVHVLCVVPKRSAAIFEEKTLKWWNKQSPGKPESNGIVCKFRKPIGLRAEHEQQVFLFRYIIKTVSDAYFFSDAHGHCHSCRKIFKPEPNDCTPVFVEVPQLYGISHQISLGAQRKEGFVSKFNQRLFDEIYSGWEFPAKVERDRDQANRRFLASFQIGT